LKSLLILSFILSSGRSRQPPNATRQESAVAPKASSRYVVFALSIMVGYWAAAILAVLFDAGLAIVWRALLVGSIVGATELFVRLRNRP
jgi:hypothetical protein